MRNFGYVFACLMIVCVAAWAYNENYKTKEALDHVQSLQAQISREKEVIGILKAEWAYLNRPEYLMRMTNLFFNDLQLVALSPDHFGTAALIPMPQEKSLILSELRPRERPEGNKP